MGININMQHTLHQELQDVAKTYLQMDTNMAVAMDMDMATIFSTASSMSSMNLSHLTNVTGILSKVGC